jgi:hypothetical protein
MGTRRSDGGAGRSFSAVTRQVVGEHHADRGRRLGAPRKLDPSDAAHRRRDLHGPTRDRREDRREERREDRREDRREEHRDDRR